MIGLPRGKKLAMGRCRYVAGQALLIFRISNSYGSAVVTPKMRSADYLRKPLDCMPGRISSTGCPIRKPPR